MIEQSLNPALPSFDEKISDGWEALRLCGHQRGLIRSHGRCRPASGARETIYQRKRVNLHPTRYRRPFGREKGQFVSKTRIRGPLVSSAGSIGTSITTRSASKSVLQSVLRAVEWLWVWTAWEWEWLIWLSSFRFAFAYKHKCKLLSQKLEFVLISTSIWK